MSCVRLVVRDTECDWSGTVHGSNAERVIAALAADPTTLQELEIASARFAKPAVGHRFLANMSPGVDEEPYDAGLVVIDLVARQVVQDSTYSFLDRNGGVAYHDGRCGTNKVLPYHLAEDWLFTRTAEGWRHASERRHRERAAKPPPDARAVFYGKPLLEFIARELFARFDPEADAAERIRVVHASWMLTPRADLGGACPREILVERRSHVGWELQDRGEAWSVLGACPPPLDASSHAFRFGGFGTHEAVTYYELVRELMWSCWERLVEPPHVEFQSAGDVLAEEIPRLEGVREAWLDAPDPEFHGRTPRSIIHRERARIPEAMSRHEAVADPDCPCCQAMADMPGLAFWHLDGCNMDDDFAFDFHHKTREQWDDEKRKWEEHSRQFNAKWAERERLGVTGERDPVWSRSLVSADADRPVGIRVFAIGCRLAELIVALRDGADGEPAPAAVQTQVDQLNRDFGNLRDVLQGADDALAALIGPVLDRFAESLAGVAAARADLAARCESLTTELHGLLDPSGVDPDDFGMPY